MARTRFLQKKTLAEARNLFVDGWAVSPRPEIVPVEESVGRVLHEPVFARLSVPHYHGAAMDGIAVRSDDTFGASEAQPRLLKLGAAQSGFTFVDTGQPLPTWANAVVMIEHVQKVSEDTVAVFHAAPPWQHVRLVGEDVVAGEPLLPRGHRIRPYDVGALLAAGYTQVAVAAKPLVGIVPTGSELVEPGTVPPPGGIVEFNSRVTAAFVTEWGGTARRYPIVPDDLPALREALSRVLSDSEVVVWIAGSSAGEHDFTLQLLQEFGEIVVHGIDVMPGKPAICAYVQGKPVLGLPGYPVSAVIVAQQLLRPLIYRALGQAEEEPQKVRARVTRKVPSKLGLEEFVRVSLGVVGKRVIAAPLPRGAGAISTLVRADGYLRVPSSREGVNADEEVEVELLRPWSEVARTILLTGSHDLALGYLEDALRQRDPAFRLACANVGSLAGLLGLARGEGHVAGCHLLDPDSGTYNLVEVRTQFRPKDIVVVHLAVRQQGLLVSPGNPKSIRALKDLTRPDVRFVNRQPGAGTRILLDYLLTRDGIRKEEIHGYEREEFTHMAVAAAVASGIADCGLGIAAAAQAMNLDFVPLEREEYDLVLRRDFAQSPAGQALLAAIRSPAFRERVAVLRGYDVSRSGEIKNWDTKLAPGVKRVQTT